MNRVEIHTVPLNAFPLRSSRTEDHEGRDIEKKVCEDQNSVVVM